MHSSLIVIVAALAAKHVYAFGSFSKTNASGTKTSLAFFANTFMMDRPRVATMTLSSLDSLAANDESSATLPPSSTELIEAAEHFMTRGTGYFSPLKEDKLLAPDFIFRGPVIGPLNKQDYAEVLEYFSVYKALPDIQPNCFGFSTDPQDPYRVWFFLRATGTYQEPLGGTLGKLASQVTPPDGRVYHGSTEAWSLTFNEQKQVRYISAGYVVDRFEPEATTKGKGLTFGVLASLGLELPSGVNDVRLQFIQRFTQLFTGSNLFPKAFSDASSVPKWWKSDSFGAD